LAEATRELVGSVEGASAVTFEVWDERRIVEERLGGLLGVARGSAEVPRLIRVGYLPTHPPEVGRHVPHIVLVGKGITFDSGGLSLKSADGMSRMKTDMSGAAAVLAAVSACAALGVTSRVTAIVPATENMPGGSAIKPGDVLVVRDGQTIEVLNTDAEGRLVLADALSLAAELRPDVIVALGRSIAGLFGNDDVLVGKVIEAAARAGERVWQLPLAQEYASHIESDVADMKNTGKADQAGSIAAALLLERFVHGIPWVHMDIAGPARSDEDHGLITKGGTGFGVRTLLELLDTYGGSSPA
jgi:leucyl aminopeptidase